jgi:hypothetical protein
MDEDPGWRLTWSALPALLVPQLAMRRMARSDADPLVALRSLFLTFCAAIVGVGIVATVLGDVTVKSHSSGVSLAIAVAAGCASLLAQRFYSRPLDCTSLDSLRSSYTTRFFLRVAFADAAALVGFMLDIAMGPWWVYFVGAGFAAVGLAQVSPTRRHLAQDQDELSIDGCTRSLTEALRRSTPASGGHPQFR